MKGFTDFVRNQGVAGLAVGFVLGGAVSGLVASLVNDVVNPLLGILFDASSLSAKTVNVSDATLGWGNLVAVAINFVLVAAVAYWGVKALKLDKKK
ncbi:MAG TPA: MscL family protein [Candidatus Saccharimonadales bacterium]